MVMMVVMVVLVLVLMALIAVVVMMMIVGYVSVERRFGMFNSMSSEHAKHFARGHFAIHHLDQIALDN